MWLPSAQCITNKRTQATYLSHRRQTGEPPREQRPARVFEERELLQERVDHCVLSQAVGADSALGGGEGATRGGQRGEVAVEAVLAGPGGSAAGEEQQRRLCGRSATIRAARYVVISRGRVTSTLCTKSLPSEKCRQYKVIHLQLHGT